MGRTYICGNCGSDIPIDKYLCPSCKTWHVTTQPTNTKVVTLKSVTHTRIPRYSHELINKVTGGGIPHSSVTLLGADAGAGKSTLCLQLAGALAGDPISKHKFAANKIDRTSVLYIATEESNDQLKERATRLGISDNAQECITVANAMGGMQLQEILEEVLPDFIIIDSLPGFMGEGTDDGIESLHTIRVLKLWAEQFSCPSIIADHITKTDDFAGWKRLQHAVDILLVMTINVPDDESQYKVASSTQRKQMRTIRAKKNRHGPAPVETYLLMTERGLKIPSIDDTREN